MSNHNYCISYDEMVKLIEKIKEFHKKKCPETTVGDYGNFLCGTGRENLASIGIFDEFVIRSETPICHKENEGQDIDIENPSMGLVNLLGLGGANDI